MRDGVFGEGLLEESSFGRGRERHYDALESECAEGIKRGS